MVRLNLCLDDIGNREETTVFIKYGVLNLAYIQGLLFEKSKQLSTSLPQVKLVKVLEE